MIKPHYILINALLATCLTTTSFALSSQPTQQERDAAAIACKPYLTANTNPLENVSQENAIPAANALKLCMKYASCNNANLAGIQHCSRKLQTLSFANKYYSMEKPSTSGGTSHLGQTATQPKQQIQPVGAQTKAPVAEKMPAPKPVTTPTIQPKKPTPKKESIKWF